MSSFDNLYKNFNAIVKPHVISLLTNISEYKGKQHMYEQQSPEVLKKLQQVATIQSTESSNRIEGIVINSPRLRKLMNDKTNPVDRSENEVAAYRSVLNLIHSATKDISITPNVMKQLHQRLYEFSPREGGHWKMKNNDITEKYPDGEVIIRFQPTPAHLTEIAITDLCERFQDEMLKKEIHDLILIASFIFDFLCIHPFTDGNGRMARLLTILCLYHGGYHVGRFISIEKIIEDTKETYYSSLNSSSQKWHQGEHNLLPWIEYFLGVILKAYKELESRVGIVKQTRGQKGERIREIIKGFITSFTVAEIEERCPDISRPTINSVLGQMARDNIIERQGFGKNTKWKLLNK